MRPCPVSRIQSGQRMRLWLVESSLVSAFRGHLIGLCFKQFGAITLSLDDAKVMSAPNAGAEVESAPHAV